MKNYFEIELLWLILDKKFGIKDIIIMNNYNLRLNCVFEN